MTVDDEIREIKADKVAEMINSEVLLIERKGPRYIVHQWLNGGVAPQSDYFSKEEAAARLLQLLGIEEAVMPQAHPEICEIGSIDQGGNIR